MKLRVMLCMAVLSVLLEILTVSAEETKCEIKVNDTVVTQANAEDVLGDGTVRYSEADAHLSLKGASLRKLSVEGAVTLEVTGENTIREGMTVNGALTLYGAGCLTVTGGIKISEGSSITPAPEMRVWADNVENGLGALDVTELIADVSVYSSPYIRIETSSHEVRYCSDGTCIGNERDGKHYDGMPLILPNEVYFTREGYTQTGWREKESGRVYRLGEAVSEGAGTVYYPAWTVNRYTVTFRLENGEADLVLTVEYGAALQAPADPVRVGYRFCGWDLPLPDTMPAHDLTRRATWSIYCDHSGNTAERSCSEETACSVCGARLEKIPHREKADDGDCTTPVTCERCGMVLVKACDAHRFSEWKVLPDGSRYRECVNSDCTYSETERVQPPTPTDTATSTDTDTATDTDINPNAETGTATTTAPTPSTTEPKPTPTPTPSEDTPTSEAPDASAESTQAPSNSAQKHGCSATLGGIPAVLILPALALLRRRARRKD